MYASAIVKCSAFPHCAVNWCYTNPLAHYYLKTLCVCVCVCVRVSVCVCVCVCVCV